MIGYGFSPATDADPLGAASAGRIAGAVAAGEVTAAEVVGAAVARAEAAVGLNACAVPRYERAGADAERIDAAGRGARPLEGVPVTVKESLWVRGTPCCGGIDRLAGSRSRRDGEVARSLRAAGAIVLGKGNVSQALWYAEPENPVYGRTEHPCMPGRSPGGSTGGDAALVAAGVVPVAVGTDMGGSVRIPAAWCGVFGMVPTPGQVELAGSRDAQLFAGQDLIRNRPGVLARGVADLRTTLAVLAGEHPEPPPAARPLRVGVVRTNGVLEPAPAVRRAVLEAAATLGGRDVTLEEVELPDAAEALAAFDAVFRLDGGRRLRRMLAGSRLHPHLERALTQAEGQARSPEQVRALADRIAELRGRFTAMLGRRRLDAVLGPVHALAAVPHGASQDVVCGQSYASIWSLYGMPAGVAPVTLVRPDEETDRTGASAADAAARRAEEGSAGLPVGVQVAARPGGDAIVLTLLDRISSH